MKNLFNSIKVDKAKSNVFDLTHDFKFSCKGGNLYPCLIEPTMPGDKFKIGAEMVVRCAPMIAPPMHRLDATIHYFFVPNRLVWDHWEDFITGQNKDGTTTPRVMPYIELDGATPAALTILCQYMGIEPPPTSTAFTREVCALPFAAYNKIWNEYYRDQNQMNVILDSLVDGLNSNANFGIKQRSWEHDYFTAALPFAQKGDPVAIPIGNLDVNVQNATDVNLQATGGGYNPTVPGELTDPLTTSDLYAKGESNTTNINDLRRAYAVQRWLEKMARGGSRYYELIKNMFNVTASDARLQRPEYITGTKAPIVVSEVLNTTGTEDAPQGSMAGHGISVTDGFNGTYYCEEHGYIIGIVSIMPKIGYTSGIPKHFLYRDRLEYPWPDFARIGEQPIQNQELTLWTTDPEGTFGYIPRYAEWKTHIPRVAGEFLTTLNMWHLNRQFEIDAPYDPIPLNESFIKCEQYDFDRIFAVSSSEADQFYCHIMNNVQVIRKLPKYGNPI